MNTKPNFLFIMADQLRRDYLAPGLCAIPCISFEKENLFTRAMKHLSDCGRKRPCIILPAAKRHDSPAGLVA